MTSHEKDLLTFLTQMPDVMKQDAIKGMEFLRRMTVADYKEQQIKAAEALILDIQAAPDKYTTAKLNNLFPEILGYYEISEDLQKSIEIIKHFVSFRTSMKINTDRTVVQHRGATYEDYLQSEEYSWFLEHMKKKKKR